MSNGTSFWPNNARLAVSFSLMYEGGGQPISGAPGVIPEPIENNLPDIPTNGVSNMVSMKEHRGFST